MEEKLKIKIDEEFKPSPQLKKLYYIYLALAALIGIFTWYFPVLLFTPLEVKLGISIPILAILIFAAFWIQKYYDTIVYSSQKMKLYGGEGFWESAVFGIPLI